MAHEQPDPAEIAFLSSDSPSSHPARRLAAPA